MKKGLFIVFEGAEGSGKSTQINLLSRHLVSSGYSVVATREPGGGRIGGRIRDVLLDPEFKEMDYKAEALLYAANRAQHVSEVIKPALKEKKIVLCDRYIDSSLAYQGFGRGLSIDKLIQINDWAAAGLKADLVFVLLVPVEEGLKRATKNAIDRIEEEDVEFHKRVASGYKELAGKDLQRYKCIDALKDTKEIHEAIVDIVEGSIKEKLS